MRHRKLSDIAMDWQAGDSKLRMLLIHGARCMLLNAKRKGTWSEGLLKQRPTNVVSVALVNNMVRATWVITTHRRTDQRDYASV